MATRFNIHRAVPRTLVGAAAVALSFSAAIGGTVLPSPRTAAAAGPVQIQMKNFAFDPPTITISAGQTLVWTNDDVVPHTSTANAKAWDSRHVDPGHSFKVTLTKPGMYDYGCSIHPFMHAKIVVMK